MRNAARASLAAPSAPRVRTVTPSAAGSKPVTSTCRSTATPSRLSSSLRIASVSRCGTTSRDEYGVSVRPMLSKENSAAESPSTIIRPPVTMTPRSRKRSAKPRERKSSMLRACTARARDSCACWVFWSKIRTRTPWRASSAAASRPVGPAPTTMTSASGAGPAAGAAALDGRISVASIRWLYSQAATRRKFFSGREPGGWPEEFTARGRLRNRRP